jgi:hypothetical protein
MVNGVLGNAGVGAEAVGALKLGATGGAEGTMENTFDNDYNNG